ncbi:MAG TPA: hypothetical protein VJ722_01475 [Rhodanobacteraceae bacterium]|nr:hypothetical protein [Rhodanobacteraceae bacterium]
MRSGTRLILASLSFAALSSIPLAAPAGESPYNPRLAQCATLPTAAAAQACANAAAPHPAQDFSYFCHAGNKGPSHTLYITPVHHLGQVANPSMTQQSMDVAWTQAIRGQRDAYLPECQMTLTSDVQRQRQDVLAQPRTGTVNVEWQYGQNGPAMASQ